MIMKRSFAFLRLSALYCSVVRQLPVHSPKLWKRMSKKGERVDQRGMEAIGKFFYTGVCFSKYRTYLEEDPENRIELVGIAIGKNVK